MARADNMEVPRGLCWRNPELPSSFDNGPAWAFTSVAKGAVVRLDGGSRSCVRIVGAIFLV